MALFRDKSGSLSFFGKTKDLALMIMKLLRSRGIRKYSKLGDGRLKIWERIPFLGKPCEFLVKRLVEKLQRNLSETTKISYFLPKKNKIPDLSRNDVIYESVCPVCKMSYVEKTERNSATRLSEHLNPLETAN